MANTTTENTFLGVGFKYPMQTDTIGQVAKVGGRESIRQSIAEILSTPIGERFFNRGYGSNLHLLTFEQNDDILHNLLRTYTQEAIFNNERRVKLTDIEFEDVAEHGNVSLVNVTLKYQILGSNEIDTFIYPFYREIQK